MKSRLLYLIPFLLPLLIIIINKIINSSKKMIVPFLSYNEVVNSTIAKKYNIDNTPDDQQLLNIKELAINIFTPLRNHFNNPIRVTSFFRSKQLNSFISGAYNSQHIALNGSAMDIQGVKNSNYQLFHFIKDNLDFDQLIWEFGNNNEPSWVHVSYNKNNNRKQVLKASKINGKTVYTNF